MWRADNDVRANSNKIIKKYNLTIFLYTYLILLL